MSKVIVFDRCVANCKIFRHSWRCQQPPQSYFTADGDGVMNPNTRSRRRAAGRKEAPSGAGTLAAGDGRTSPGWRTRSGPAIADIAGWGTLG